MEVREQVAPTDKTYCCSNYPQTEATLIAKFDLVVAVIGLLSTVTTLSVIASKSSAEPVTTTPLPPSSPAHHQATSIVPNQNITTDLSLFFQWPRESQLWWLSFNTVGKVLGIVLSILLFFGVKKRHHGYLLTWFIVTLISVIFSVIFGVMSVILASERLFLSILVIASFLYNWYCLWIVKLLMSEIRGVREGYRNPLDDGEIEHANNLVPSSDSFTVVTVDKF